MIGDLKKKLKKWISNKTEECKSVGPLYSIALDRKLTLIEKFRVRFHLMFCNACTSYVSNLDFMHEVFHAEARHIEEEKIHVSLSAESKEKLKKALEAARPKS